MNKKIIKILLFIVIFLSVLNGGFAQEQEVEQTREFPIIGEIDVGEMPLILSTMLIASADGLNPCSIWVLLFLLGLVLHTGSRKKIAFIGGTFLLVTTAIYGAFILGIHYFLSFIDNLRAIEIIVATIAILFGLVNIKDYFWYKKGISFTIPDNYKPKFAKNIRELMKKGSYLPIFIGTVIIASGVAIVELPCTSGLPMIWTGLVTSLGVSGLEFMLYLGVYLFMYLLIEIIILTTVLISLKSFRIDEFRGRVLKLLGGNLIIGLALILLIDRTIMYDFIFIMLIMLIIILLTTIIIVFDKIIRGDKNETSK